MEIFEKVYASCRRRCFSRRRRVSVSKDSIDPCKQRTAMFRRENCGRGAIYSGGDIMGFATDIVLTTDTDSDRDQASLCLKKLGYRET